MKIETKSKFHDSFNQMEFHEISILYVMCAYTMCTRVTASYRKWSNTSQDTLIIREEIDWFVSFVYSILAPAVATVTRGVIRQQQ